jgi:hypothetical protein
VRTIRQHRLGALVGGIVEIVVSIHVNSIVHW